MDGKTRRGFTLIEVLLVISIISLLTFVVINAVNPRKHLAQAHDTKRQSDVLSIVNAVNQYYIDRGSLPFELQTAQQQICKTTAVECTAVDLSFLVPTFIADVPSDPLAEGDLTGYYIGKDWQGRTVVVAPMAEQTQSIMAVN